MLKEWIVTLYKHEDLDGFYEDMETPGGNLYIPDRAVDVTKQRPISRNTNYMLTYEEAMLIKDDERVWDVDLLEKLEESMKPAGYRIETDGGTSGKPAAQYARNWSGHYGDINWGLLRQTDNANRDNWGNNGTSEIGAGEVRPPEYNNCLVVGLANGAQYGFITELQATGHTVTYLNSESLPADISGYQQIYDLRYNTAISTADGTKYYAFLQNRGFLYLTGEHSGFPHRNNSISNFISPLGGGTLTVSGSSLNQQTANATFFPTAPTITYSAIARYINTNGTGRPFTTDARGRSGAMMWIGNGGDLTSDLNGTIVTVADINWTMPAYYNSTNQAFLRKMIYGIVYGTTTGTIQEDGSNIAFNLIITASGRNVDVLIVDGHIDPGHPEFSVNSNGSGGSRVVQYNWFQNNVGAGTGSYVYTPYAGPGSAEATNNHGVHVGGTAAGNSQGWARDANIYNLNPLNDNPNWGVLGFGSDTFWDYIRAWHNSKPINPVTGRVNPTISNHSYSSQQHYNQGVWGPITAVTYRGTHFSPGRALTVAELQARGFYTDDDSPGGVPAYSVSFEADIQDAMDDGIVMCGAAGNESWKIVNSADQDYNNTLTAYLTNYGYSTQYYHRGNGYGGAGYAPHITVGAIGINKEDYKSTFSNCGSQVDIFAAGTAIHSSLHTPAGAQFSSAIYDNRNTNYYKGKMQGTSMASPQVCGILACLAEHWPNMRQAEAHQWLIDFCNENQITDTGADNAMDIASLQGAPNRFAKWTNQRPVDGAPFPQRNFRPRHVDDDLVYYGKRMWPRPRIRRRG